MCYRQVAAEYQRMAQLGSEYDRKQVYQIRCRHCSASLTNRGMNVCTVNGLGGGCHGVQKKKVVVVAMIHRAHCFFFYHVRRLYCYPIAPSNCFQPTWYPTRMRFYAHYISLLLLLLNGIKMIE